MTACPRSTAFWTGALWMLALPAYATTLFSNGVNSQTPPQAGVGIYGSNTSASSFSISPAATLASVSFYSLECCGIGWSGTINYYLFSNNGFYPSTAPFAQGSASSYKQSTIYSDAATNVVNRYDFNLSTAVALSANTTYWIGIRLSDDGSKPFWNLVSSGISAHTGSDFNSWNLQTGTGAFALFDTTFQTAPEPGSAWMLLVGTGLFAGAGWKRPVSSRHIECGDGPSRPADHEVAAGLAGRR